MTIEEEKQVVVLLEEIAFQTWDSLSAYQISKIINDALEQYPAISGRMDPMTLKIER
jgi:hypothetical protein